MTWIIAAAVIMAIALAVLVKLAQKRGPGPTGYPYKKTGALFSPAERSFLGVLHQAVEGKASIFGKVRVADVVEPKTGLNHSDHHQHSAIFYTPDQELVSKSAPKDHTLIPCSIGCDLQVKNFFPPPLSWRTGCLYMQL